MTAESHKFEYRGAQFAVTVDPNTAATTTNAPNLRVIDGTWKTWFLEFDPDVPGISAIRLRRSVSSSGGQHPSGNLNATQSGPIEGYMLMASSEGNLYRIPGGYAAVSRLYTDAQWQYQLAEWEASL